MSVPSLHRESIDKKKRRDVARIYSLGGGGGGAQRKKGEGNQWCAREKFCLATPPF